MTRPALVLAAIALAGCSSTVAEPVGPGTSAPVTAPPSTTATTAPSTTEPAAVTVLMPLTGEPLDPGTAIPSRPALAVKIDNHPAARPQSGLNEADVVFEENVEALTRFAAVFHSTGAEVVGPIRSGRSQDISILTAFDRPLFAWSGGNDGVRRLVRNSDLVDLDAARTSGYYRIDERRAPHNLYSGTEALWVHAPADARIPPRVFEYLGAGEEPSGPPAREVRVPMDGVAVRWEYDATSGLYLRWHAETPHRSTSGQVSTANLVVMGVEYRQSEEDRRSPEASVIGSGPVHVFSRGTVRSGTWTRERIGDPYRFRFSDGGEIRLRPGRTFVMLARAAEGFAAWD